MTTVQPSGGQSGLAPSLLVVAVIAVIWVLLSSLVTVTNPCEVPVRVEECAILIQNTTLND